MRRVIGLLVIGLLAGCAGPEAIRLDGEPSPEAASLPGLEGAERDAEDLEVRPLELKGVRGGEIALLIDGSPEQVSAMLLDFAHADGHRAWAREYRLLDSEGEEVRAEWRFEGKMGVDPTVELSFRRIAGVEPIVLRYELSETAFGLAAFFGDYRIQSVPGDPARSLLVERVFIDSGLFFVNASAEDIAAGLREDARLMRAWMRERLGLSGARRIRSPRGPGATARGS
jgi:hypothetical protein